MVQTKPALFSASPAGTEEGTGRPVLVLFPAETEKFQQGREHFFPFRRVTGESAFQYSDAGGDFRLHGTGKGGIA